MGSCLSKKTSNSTHILQPQSEKTDVLKTTDTDLKRVGLVEEDRIKKEIFVIKHRKSHEISSISPQEKSGFNSSSSPVAVSPQICVSNSPAVEIAGGVNVVVPISQPIRTSSCSKEEVDAILIQCGRLSRSSSGSGKVAASGGRNYSGSKRSYDFDNCDIENENEKKGELVDADNRVRPHRQSRGSPSPHGRRRTPSRERDQQRSGSASRDRVLSRSPARRRSEHNNASSSRPGRIVTVPATVMDKSNNGNEGAAAQGSSIKRVLVKRNVASPRSQSPAKGNQSNVVEVLNENQDVHLAKPHQPSLSRSSSRKETDQSPFRRRPLNEISSNSNKTATNIVVSQAAPMVKPTAVEAINKNSKVTEPKANNGRVTNNTQDNKVVTVITERTKEEQDRTKPIMETAVIETVNPQTLTRSRSSRKSRDLDLDASSNATNTYASILLQDIQNFHQKSNTTTNPSFSLPPCLNKVCSILEAVADLNSSTGGSDRLSNSPLQQYSINTNYDVSKGTKTQTELKSKEDPFVESEVTLSDELMAPSLHKYVTMRRGNTTAALGDEDREEQESSGSNSVGGQQQYWEPKSADSTDRSTTREAAAVPSRRLSAKKRREYEPQQSRIEHSSRVGGASRGLRSVSAAGST